MTPRSSTLLALIGVLLAGIPLPALTGARRELPEAEMKTLAEAPPHPTYATLHCSGHALGLRLLHEGRELARLSAKELALTPCELELKLPNRDKLGLEIIATWAEGEHSQAVSLTLEPEGRPSRQCTQWTEPGSNTLHSLFSFIW